MDTKPLEIESESLIQHELIKHGFHVTKPSFDKEGIDLLIVDNIKDKFTRFLKIQCKGRTLSSSGSYIEIPDSYVKENFIVFLYIVNEDLEHVLLTFFNEDIYKWKKTNNKYILRFTHKKLKEPYFLESVFNKNIANKIKDKLNKSEIKKYTSVIIDGIFLEKSIDKTINSYKEIYPDRTFCYPDLKDIVSSILSTYDHFHSHEKIINCYVYYYVEDIDQIRVSSKNKKFTTEDGVEGKVYVEYTDDFVCFEIIDFLERVINTENIILVADDVVYEKTLNNIKERGIDIILVMSRFDDGRRMITNHKWGNITYPLATSIGLERHEW